MADEEGVAVNIDEHCSTPDEVMAKIATEYNITRLQSKAGLDEYFGRGADGKVDLTKASGLTAREVDPTLSATS
jgi:hypothetical protein